MNDHSILSAFGMHIINDCLIIPLNGDMDDKDALELQKEIMEKVKKTVTKKVLIDVSALRLIDARTFSVFRHTAQMISMVGAKTVFVGFQAGVASALVDLEVDFGDIHTAVSMEDGLELLQSMAIDFTLTHHNEKIISVNPSTDLQKNEWTYE